MINEYNKNTAGQVKFQACNGKCAFPAQELADVALQIPPGSQGADKPFELFVTGWYSNPVTRDTPPCGTGTRTFHL